MAKRPSTPKIPEKAHAELGASSSKRWMNCPGSVPLSRGIENRASSYATEGTVAHTLAEMAMEGKVLPSVGTIVQHDGFDILIDQEMHEAVDVYCRTLSPIGRRADWYGLEQRVQIHSITDAELFGTADFVAIEGTELVVGDLKYGKGVSVDVEANTQLMFYGLAVFETLEVSLPKLIGKVKTVRLVVVQPRVDGTQVKIWDVGVGDLLMWRDTVLVPAVEQIVAGSEELHDGDWCRFCPVLPTCPLKHTKAVGAAQALFAMEGEEVDNTSLGSALALVRSIQDYAKAVETMAVERLSRGELVPGWKLVEGRSLRVWGSDTAQTLHTISARTNAPSGLMEELVTEPTLRSPAQVEKVLKTQGWKPERILDGLVVKPPGKPTLVEDTDPRPALEKLSAAEAFSELTEV